MGDGDDEIYGGLGNDTLNGGSGYDWLDGGDGDDYFRFSPGASLGGMTFASDHFDGGPGLDYIDFSYFERGEHDAVFVDLNLNTYDATVSDESGATIYVQGTLWNIEGVSGTSGTDILLGDSFENEIYGWEGDDVIYGRGGNDRIIGGQGNDEVFGGPGDDIVGGEPGADLVVGGDGDDIVMGSENGVGDLTDDVLWGGNQDDDVATGNDVFKFRKSFGTDTIMDYQQDETIHLTGLVGGFYRDEMSFSVLDISDVGNDIVISFYLKRGGGAGGTIILKDAATNGIIVDESDFIID